MLIKFSCFSKGFTNHYFNIYCFLRNYIPIFQYFHTINNNTFKSFAPLFYIIQWTFTFIHKNRSRTWPRQPSDYSLESKKCCFRKSTDFSPILINYKSTTTVHAELSNFGSSIFYDLPSFCGYFFIFNPA